MKYAKFACIPIMLMMFLGFTGCGNKSAHTENITAQNGVIDLSEWKFSSDGNVKLDGEWAFYWDKLIAPGEFGSAVEPTGYYSVPGYWTHYRDLNLPSKGLATYRLIIKTNGNYSITKFNQYIPLDKDKYCA